MESMTETGRCHIFVVTSKLIRFHYVFIFMCHSLFLFTFTHLMRQREKNVLFHCRSLNGGNSSSLRFSMSLNKNNGIRMWRRSFQFLLHIHIHETKHEIHTVASFAFSLFLFFSYRLNVFISEKRLFMMFFTVLYQNIYICYLFWVEWKRTHARTVFTPEN